MRRQISFSEAADVDDFLHASGASSYTKGPRCDAISFVEGPARAHRMNEVEHGVDTDECRSDRLGP